jgi:Flp pilus assembly protein TadD
LYFLCFLLALADPGKANSLLQQGLTALQQGRLQDARESLEQASTIDPGNPYAWTSLAQTYFRLKDPQRSLAAARSAEKVGSRDPIVCHALAMYYTDSGNFARAAQFEARFAESSKSDPDATARAAALYLNAGDNQNALSLARKSALQQHSAANEDLLGRALIASGQLTEGTLHFQDAARPAPADPRIAFDYSQALLRKQEFGGAADALGSALQAHPGDPQLVLAMGVARYGQRRFEECITLFLQVIKLDPKIEQPYTFLGQILDQAGPHLSEITEAYKAWLARKPRNATASLLLAKALVIGGNDGEAEVLIRRSISIDNRRWDSHYELGLLEMKKHRYQQALAELIWSRNLAPGQPTPHYQLARVYDRLGQPEEAKAERAIHEKLSSSSMASHRP